MSPSHISLLKLKLNGVDRLHGAGAILNCLKALLFCHRKTNSTFSTNKC